jgi:hypothetical protein
MEDNNYRSTHEVEELATLNNACAMNKCMEVYNANQLLAQQKLNEGNELLNCIDAKGMNDDDNKTALAYVRSCVALKDELNAHRSDITRMLTGVQRRFTSLENSINPANEGSPAATIVSMLTDYERQRLQDIRNTERALTESAEMAQNAVLNNNELSEEEKKQEIHRIKSELIEKQMKLKAHQINTRWTPEVISKEGYLELMNYWWVNMGQNMNEKELQKALYPMISFANKQAMKNVFINSEFINYNEIPCIK